MKGFPGKGPKDWTPNRNQQILRGLNDSTVEIGAGPLPHGHPFLSVAHPLEGSSTFLAYHVTDDPTAVAKVLAEGGDLAAHQRGNGDCGGLYVSLSPNQWKRRSQKRWDFLDELTERAKFVLETHLLADLRSKRQSKYITENEYRQAAEGVKVWRKGDVEPYYISFIAGQPWNVDIVGMARHHKLAEPFKPYAVPVVFTGRYLEYNNETQYWLVELAEDYFKVPENIFQNISKEDLCEVLRAYGWDGLYEAARFGNPSQVLIWNADKIVSFGTPEESARLSGRSGPSWKEGATIHEGRRFETGLSPNGQKAILQEIADHYHMFGPMGLPHVQELLEMVERLRTGLLPEQGRFKADLSKELPEIVDTQIYRRIGTLTAEDLAEMSFLLEDLLEQMDQMESA